MDNETGPRPKRRRLNISGAPTEQGDHEQDGYMPIEGLELPKGHVYQAPVRLDGNSQAIFGNVNYFGTNARITSDDVYERSFLNSIYFEDMESNRLNIGSKVGVPKHVEWIWATNFMAWLHGSKPFYWVNGKAGSGKSWLMKYVSESRKTLDALQINGEKWIILHYFFDSRAGSGIANSIHGMLRSLLYQMVRRSPDVRKLIQCAYYVDHFRGDNLHDCVDVLCDVMRYTSYRICVFLDGLDEVAFQQEDQIVQLIEILYSLENRCGIKICMSSRPLNLLVENFSAFECFGMQDHNYVAMKILASAQLRKDCMPDLASPSYGMIELFRLKAGDTNLWPAIVIGPLRDGLMENQSDRCSEIEGRLMSRLVRKPKGLVGLYRHILQVATEQQKPHVLCWAKEITDRTRETLIIDQTSFQEGLERFLQEENTRDSYCTCEDCPMDERDVWKVLVTLPLCVQNYENIETREESDTDNITQR